jgi:hypothetical protein
MVKLIAPTSGRSDLSRPTSTLFMSELESPLAKSKHHRLT